MSILIISKLDFSSEFPRMEEVSEKLDDLGSYHNIEIVNWEQFGYRPHIVFTMAYSSKEIFLKFRVKEDFLIASKTESNQSVWEDSCVEFFFYRKNVGAYYNFEFNAIGTCLAGVGIRRENRALLEKEVIDTIRRYPSLGKVPILEERTGPIEWELTVAIPFVIFGKEDYHFFEGRKFKANFYKCGNKLSVPHFLTWSPVKTEKPDFHTPEFFGDLIFC